MKKLLDTYLKKNGLNRSDVARQSNINLTTIQRSALPWPDGRDREADEINSSVTFAIAGVLKKTPGKVLNEIIEMEMENDMTTDETKLLLINVLDQCDATALVTVDDMGEDSEVIVAEIDLPSQETIRFAVNNFSDKAINRWDVLTDLAYAMDDYDQDGEDDGLLYPVHPSEDEKLTLVDYEYMGVSEQDADYLAELGSKVMKFRG